MRFKPNRIVSIFLTVAMLIGFTPFQTSFAQGSIATPYIQTNNFFNVIDQDGADPWVYKHSDGYYYMTKTTGNNITLWKSKTLTQITAGDSKVVFTPPSTGSNTGDIWAPELHFIDGAWYIYYAADQAGDNATHRMFVLRNRSADPFTGTWEDLGKIYDPTNDKWAIDGTVLENSGKLYFIWSGWEGDTNVAQNLYIAPMDSPSHISKNRVLISVPTLPWEANTNPKINEGPEVVTHGNTINLIYSASGSWTDTYCLGLLTANTSANLLEKASWLKHTNPIFQSANGVYGPGHASFVQSPDGTEDWIVYHAAKHQGSGWDRSIRTQKFTWNRDDTPNLGAPVNPNVASKLPAGEPSRDRYEAESATLGGNARVVSSANASGGAKVGGIDNAGPNGTDFVEFQVNVPSAGWYVLTGRTDNGTGGWATQDLTVNGGSSVSFPIANPGWENYGTTTVRVQLNAGVNTIRLAHNSGFAEDDCIDVYPFQGESDTSLATWSKNTQLRVSNIATRSVTLSWAAAIPTGPYAPSYRISWNGGLSAVTVPAGVYSYKVTGLKPATSYTFTVQAVNLAGLATTDGPSATATTSVIKPIGTFYNVIDQDGADPWVYKHTDGYYYMTKTTGNNITITKSHTLTGIGSGESKVVFTPPATGPNSHDLWAPELHWINGAWYVYYAADNGDNATHRMYVLRNRSADPMQGTWEDLGKLYDPNNDNWAIDGTVLQLKGKLYFIWSGWEGDTNVAQNLYIAPMDSPSHISGNRVKISTPSLPWETNTTPMVNEGPEVLIHGSTINLVYSASGSWTNTYCLGLLTTDIYSNPLDPNAWTKHAQPVFQSGNGIFGPGHASFTKSYDNKEDWIVYHAAKYSNAGWNRNIRAQKFTWNSDNTPNFGTPDALNVPIKIPSGEPKRMRYEAEDAVLGGLSSITYNRPEASNQEKVGHIDDSNSYVEFTVNVKRAGDYVVLARTDSGAPSTASFLQSVNGTISSTVPIAVGGWDNWGVTPTIVHLNAGKNTIRYTHDSSHSNNWAEIDCIDVFANPSAKAEDENEKENSQND